MCVLAAMYVSVCQNLDLLGKSSEHTHTPDPTHIDPHTHRHT